MVMNKMSENKCIIVLLGTAQDAGVPQLGCSCENCQRALINDKYGRLVASLGIINQGTGKCFVIDCTPDFRSQYAILAKLKRKYLTSNSNRNGKKLIKNNLELDGILLTHAHMGHYTGLLQLGKEGINASAVPVFGSKKMIKFLNSNKPFSSLMKNRNLNPKIIEHGKSIKIDQNLTITPYLVQHRSDFTDTFGFLIHGSNKRLLYVPDMDIITKPVIDLMLKSDIAMIDGTFYQRDELHPRRNISLIPHTPILESMKVFKPYLKSTRIYFTHFNHTNPVVDFDSSEANYVKKAGFGLTPERWTVGI